MLPDHDGNGDGIQPGVSGPIELRYLIDADEAPSEALVQVVSAIRGESPTDMAPLYTRVDLEALDALLDSTDGPPEWSSCTVTIALERFDLVLDRRELIVVRSDADLEQPTPQP